VETVILRDRAEKTQVNYPETAETVAMREQLTVLNNGLAELQLHRYGRKIDIPIGRRIFNGSFDRGGRFYCHGPSYQNMSSDERRELTLMIDGKEHPVVEIDYSTLHIAMAYSGSGKRKPRGDQYSIKGFDRCLVKLAVNILFNALTGDQARGAIAGELTRDPQLAAKSGIDSTDTKACRALAKRVVAAICRKHYRIKSYFGSDCGARFQRHDSDMAIEVMTRMMQTTKRCPLPVHDSFLVADIDADLLEETMTEVAGGHDLHLNVKRTEGAPPGPLSNLGSQSSDSQLSPSIPLTHRHPRQPFLPYAPPSLVYLVPSLIPIIGGNNL